MSPVRAGAVALAASVWLASSPARAEPLSPWAIAAEPRVRGEADAARAAEASVMRYRATRRGAMAGGGDVLDSGRMLGELHLRDALELLEGAAATTSSDAALRLRVGEVLDELERCPDAIAVLEGVARSRASAPYRLEAWKRLAVCYAKLSRPRDEIPAYGQALALEPDAAERAVLLANRAEAFMVAGQLDDATRGYRDALTVVGTLTTFEVPLHAPTIYWGLAVALDRSGDLEGAFAAIRMARVYDPNDRRLHGPGWFFVPEYDEAWYAALGAWFGARSAASPEERADAYASALLAWERYVARAPASDLWVNIAHARRGACAREQRAASLRADGSSPR